MEHKFKLYSTLRKLCKKHKKEEERKSNTRKQKKFEVSQIQRYSISSDLWSLSSNQRMITPNPSFPINYPSHINIIKFSYISLSLLLSFTP